MNRVYAPQLSLEGPQSDVRLLRACRQAREIALFAITRQWLRAIGSRQEKIPYYDRTVILLVYSYVVIFFPQETIAREYLALLSGVHIPKKNLCIRTFMDRMEGIQLFGCFTVLLRRTERLMPLVECPENTRLLARLEILRFRWKEWLVLHPNLTEDDSTVVEAICDAERAMQYIVSDERSEARFKTKLSAFVFSFSLGFAPALFLVFKAKDMVTTFESEEIEGAEGGFAATFCSETRSRAEDIVHSLFFFIRQCMATSNFVPRPRSLVDRLSLYAPTGVEPIRVPIVLPQLDSRSGAYFPPALEEVPDTPPPDIDLGAVWDDYAD